MKKPVNEYGTDSNTQNSAQGVFMLLTMPRDKMVVVHITGAQLSSYIYASPSALSEVVWKVGFRVRLGFSESR